jgi:hypothetical protein
VATAASNEGVDAGLIIKGIPAQLRTCAGFPGSLNAPGAFMAALAERAANGIADAEGKKSRTSCRRPGRPRVRNG